jgi:DMSO/TMAO reductase YedYZ molybdopterin-dependent catalytic subunit
MANDILMAYKMNGVTLPPERGFPFELVAESKWGYKWIKWVTKIELSDDEDYRGFWESRGYSNSGDLDESFFD